MVEAAIKYLTGSWWSSAPVSTPAQAQATLDRFCVEVADLRPRGASSVGELVGRERLRGLPPLPFPAEIVAERPVGRSALVSFEGNSYSVSAALAGERQVTVRAKVGEQAVRIFSPAGVLLATHRRAPAGAGQVVRSGEHAAELQAAVLSVLTTRPPCKRKQNRPPGPAAQAAAARLRSEQPDRVVVDVERYAQLAEVAR